MEAEVASLGNLTPAASDQEAAAEVLAELKLTIKLNQQLAAGLDHGSTTELETLAERSSRTRWPSRASPAISASPSAAAPTSPNSDAHWQGETTPTLVGRYLVPSTRL